MNSYLFAFWLAGLQPLLSTEAPGVREAESPPLLVAQSEGSPAGQGAAPEAGSVRLVGKYRSVQLKDGDRKHSFFKLGKGDHLVLKVNGPTSLSLRMHGRQKNPLRIQMTLDEGSPQVHEIPFPPKERWKTFYTKVPEGEHVLTVKVPARLFVRPVKIDREPEPGEVVVNWGAPAPQSVAAGPQAPATQIVKAAQDAPLAAVPLTPASAERPPSPGAPVDQGQSAPGAQSQDAAPNATQPTLVGKYNSMALKDDGKAVDYVKLGKGGHLVLRATGPAPLILRMHGVHRKAIKLRLTLDDQARQETSLAFPPKDAWKSIYTEIPEGEHHVGLKVPANLFVRPLLVSRAPEPGEVVITWEAPATQPASEPKAAPEALESKSAGASEDQGSPSGVGTVTPIGRYLSTLLKDDGQPVEYFKLGKGKQIVLEVTGPTAVVLRMHGIHRKAIKLKLTLDDKDRRETALAFPRQDAWKSIYTQIPEGVHRLVLKVPTRLFVRPVPVTREADSAESVISWAAPATQDDAVADSRESEGEDSSAGKVMLIGRYRSMQLKDGGKSVNYLKLRKGQQIVLKVHGPVPLILRMHGIHRKPINLALALDDKEKQEQALAFPRKDAWKSIFTQIPEGLHYLSMKVPATLFVRPVKVNREPDPSESVVSWAAPPAPAPQPGQPGAPGTPSAPAVRGQESLAVAAAPGPAPQKVALAASSALVEPPTTAVGPPAPVKPKMMQGKAVSLSADLPSAKVRLIQQSAVKDYFQLVRVEYAMDGKPIAVKTDMDADLSGEVQILDTAIEPGAHTLTVRMVYRGKAWGFITYMEGYRYNAVAKYAFVATTGKTTQVTAIAGERHGFTLLLEQRPEIRFGAEIAP